MVTTKRSDEWLIDIHRVAVMVKVHPQTIRRWQRQGYFPPPVRIGPSMRSVGGLHYWRRGAIRRWLDGLEPAEAGRKSGPK